jgi:hypothetical protein
MPDSIQSYWEVLEPFFPKVNIYDGPEDYTHAMAALPRHVVLLYATHMFLAEVHDGGFLQFFWNNTGIIAPESVEGFRMMGMPMVASLLDDTATRLGSPYPRNREDRWDAMLVASGRSTRELKRIFKNPENVYIAFLEATEPLGFDLLNERVWNLANTENGGFQEAATRYARRFPPM